MSIDYTDMAFPKPTRKKKRKKHKKSILKTKKRSLLPLRSYVWGLSAAVHRRTSHPLRIRPEGIIRSRRAESISLQETSYNGAAGRAQQSGDSGITLRDCTDRIRS